ncbi:MAG: 30S ribosomal protein S4 [Elusimicrobia bacterium]|nr:30S ribosomal protein S4 [Elusimicrobiota bacterium]
MARYIGPVCKLCRREQTKLFLKGEKCFTKCILDKRATIPGMAKPQRSKPSEYMIRLREKQKLRRMASITERPFERLVTRASQSTGKTGEELLKFLECRLDNVVRRLGFAVSLKTSRQLVLHGHVRVDGRTVNIPSFEVKPGQVVQVNPKIKDNVGIKLGLDYAARKSTRPAFLEFNEAEFSGKLSRLPTREEMSFPVAEHLIVEYYSK